MFIFWGFLLLFQLRVVLILPFYLAFSASMNLGETVTNCAPEEVLHGSVLQRHGIFNPFVAALGQQGYKSFLFLRIAGIYRLVGDKAVFGRAKARAGCVVLPPPLLSGHQDPVRGQGLISSCRSRKPDYLA